MKRKFYQEADGRVYRDSNSHLVSDAMMVSIALTKGFSVLGQFQIASLTHGVTYGNFKEVRKWIDDPSYAVPPNIHIYMNTIRHVNRIVHILFLIDCLELDDSNAIVKSVLIRSFIEQELE